MTDWWSVSAAWAGAAASFAAVVVALYIAGRGWRDAAARETQAQARVVYCQAEWTNVADSGAMTSDPHAVFTVRNDSDQPVYRVYIADRDRDRYLPMVPAHGVRYEQMSRAEIERFRISAPPSLPLSAALVKYPGPVPVPVQIRDSAGLMWSRDRSGALRQVRFELAPPETARDRLRRWLRWPRRHS